MGCVDYFRPRTKARLLRGEHVHWIENAGPRREYIRQVVLSCPPWIKAAELQAKKAEARRRTERTGELHVLDHIVPLTHDRVCGLTVPWNLLQVVHWRPNAAKSNKWCPDQAELDFLPVGETAEMFR